jgi:SAM-dependent methyltransferase
MQSIAPARKGVSPKRQPKRVLNAGSGAASSRRLHRIFQESQWREIRLDIDPSVKPDLVGSVTDMSALVPSRTFDAVWVSHSLEHLHAHKVVEALLEFRRILKPDGFALITAPDLETVARMILDHGPDHVAYVSPMGPITPQDMLFGHGDSIRRGMTFMAHNSGFTCDSLGAALSRAGFPMVLCKREGFDVWAVALMEEADEMAVLSDLESAGLDLFDRVE